MLNNLDIITHVAVKDLHNAEHFYGKLLELLKVAEEPNAITFKSGDTKLFVHVSEHAGATAAPIASWKVNDVEAVVAELRDRGVLFADYDLVDSALDGEREANLDNKTASFKDPDGNIFIVSS